MITLLKVCLINPGTDRVMCTAMRKNRNHTDDPRKVTCDKCKTIWRLNIGWWQHKFTILNWREQGSEEAWS